MYALSTRGRRRGGHQKAYGNGREEGGVRSKRTYVTLNFSDNKNYPISTQGPKFKPTI